jgi:hypothetical protein
MQNRNIVWRSYARRSVLNRDATERLRIAQPSEDVWPPSGSGFVGGTRSGSEPGCGSGSGEGPGAGFGIGGVDTLSRKPIDMSCSKASDALAEQTDAMARYAVRTSQFPCSG